MANHARMVLSLIAALAWSTQVHAARGFTNEFAKGTTRPRTIAVLPAEASISRARVIETEGLVDESVQYGEFFSAEVEKQLERKGYEVQVIDADRINSDPMLQEYVVDAKRSFDEMMSQYRPKRLPKRIYNGGDSTRLLATHLGVDAIVFSKFNIQIAAPGKVVVAILIGGSMGGANSLIGIVDGDTADLEAVQIAVAASPGERTESEMEAYVALLAANTTKRIPGADPAERVDDNATDEDTLDEVESLLGK